MTRPWIFESPFDIAGLKFAAAERDRHNTPNTRPPLIRISGLSRVGTSPRHSAQFHGLISSRIVRFDVTIKGLLPVSLRSGATSNADARDAPPYRKSWHAVVVLNLFRENRSHNPFRVAPQGPCEIAQTKSAVSRRSGIEPQEKGPDEVQKNVFRFSLMPTSAQPIAACGIAVLSVSRRRT